MQHQLTTEALSTEELMFRLDHSDYDDEDKMSWHDCLMTLLQVVSVVGFCGIINFVAM